MGFMFRVQQVAVTEENTILTGHMISGFIDWRQRVEIPLDDRGQEAGLAHSEGRTASAESRNSEQQQLAITSFAIKKGRPAMALALDQAIQPGLRQKSQSPDLLDLESPSEEPGLDPKTPFTGSLRGVASAEDTGLTFFDPSLWEKVLAFPLSIAREKQISLIIEGTPRGRGLTVPAIAVGIDAPPSTASPILQTAFRSADVPAWSGAHFGVPVREYPYQISRRGMLLFAPWGLFFVTIVLCLAFVALPLNGASYGKMIACAMLGFFDVLFLVISIKMLLAKPSPMVVTTTGIKMPVILPDFTSHNVFVSFDEMDEMMEYWHKDTVQMLKLKTARGILHLNLFMMETPHFEELRRLLWHRIHDKRARRDAQYSC